MFRLGGRSDQNVIQINEIEVQVSEHKVDECMEGLHRITPAKRHLSPLEESEKCANIFGSYRNLILSLGDIRGRENQQYAK